MGRDDGDRWAALWDRHADAVYAYARRRVGPADAPDVVAEVFVVVLTRPDAVPDDALPWLYRTAWNVIANQRRAAERQRRGVGGRTTGADVADGVVERDAVLAALASLSEGDREVLMLTAWEGLDARRAAAAAGCSPATFAVRLHRARRRLDAALAESEQEASR